jgi:hypothetical protein
MRRIDEYLAITCNCDAGITVLFAPFQQLADSR